MHNLQPAWEHFTKTTYGQAFFSFARVAAATLVGLWLAAGMPISGLDGHVLGHWVEVAIQSGVTLVIANYFGPWEKRYGLNKQTGVLPDRTPVLVERVPDTPEQ